MTTTGRLRTEPGAITEEQGLRLADLACQVPATQAIVDVGADRGRSTCYLAHGARTGGGAHVYGLDPSWGPRGLQLAMLSVRQQGLRLFVTLLPGRDEEAAAAWDGPKVALIHTGAETVDLEAWRPHLADGALIAYEAGDEFVVEDLRTPPFPVEPKQDLDEADLAAARASVEGAKQEDPPAEPGTEVPNKSAAIPPAEPEPDDLNALTIARLRSTAKTERVGLRSDMRKREIVDAIRAKRAASPSPPRSRPTRTGRATSRSSSTG